MKKIVLVIGLLTAVYVYGYGAGGKGRVPAGPYAGCTTGSTILCGDYKDANGDGICDVYVDIDGNGICDSKNTGSSCGTKASRKSCNSCR